ncbi:xylose isomerase [Pedobacter antarcticus 4BY]|uniref:Xylose isomerase n=2 Tax=Pedobacter antarcticus TaxID=34086 RepID=A0A081PKS1_9SPHI|nr:TIM barrel protein [Pedobacter antarcticus]KEQ31294.1 xylose isomerase [Pedobacter antarcticus 4BY]SFE57670.1 Sugar phosphate isomerase/epimerase [Pedobacter antarcticus]
MNRRNFIRNSSVAASAALLTNSLSGFSMEAKSKFKLGLQLFTIRDAMKKDPELTLKSVAKMGYEDLETYGMGENGRFYYDMPTADFRRLLGDLGLTTSSGHYDLHKYMNSPENEMLNYVDSCIAGASSIGQNYITWPWLAPEDRTLDKFLSLARKLNLIGEHVSKAGLKLAYHNHDFDFADLGGRSGYDIIMEETDPDLVKLQIDLYWAVRASKHDPAYYFEKQPGRFEMWHIKDMDRVTQDYTELGNGTIDYKPILKHVKLSGMKYYYLEQGGNFSTGDAMDSITQSIQFFKKNLQKLV